MDVAKMIDTVSKLSGQKSDLRAALAQALEALNLTAIKGRGIVGKVQRDAAELARKTLAATEGTV